MPDIGVWCTSSSPLHLYLRAHARPNARPNRPICEVPGGMQNGDRSKTLAAQANSFKMRSRQAFPLRMAWGFERGPACTGSNLGFVFLVVKLVSVCSRFLYVFFSQERDCTCPEMASPPPTLTRRRQIRFNDVTYHDKNVAVPLQSRELTKLFKGLASANGFAMSDLMANEAILPGVALNCRRIERFPTGYSFMTRDKGYIIANVRGSRTAVGHSFWGGDDASRSAIQPVRHPALKKAKPSSLPLPGATQRDSHLPKSCQIRHSPQIQRRDSLTRC